MPQYAPRPPAIAGVIALALLIHAAALAAPTPAADTGPGDGPVREQQGRVVSPRIAPLRDALAPLIADAQRRFAIPGLSLVLVSGEQTLWSEGFGWAAPDPREPATAETLYRAGSLAKPFTALAVLQLEARGLLDIDQPLSAALPGFRVRSRFDLTGNPITPRGLLTHHAGLPTDLNKGMWTGTPFTAVLPQLRDEYTAFPPGLIFSYSNLGYSLLGHLVQASAGQPFAEYAQTQLLDPLGMTHSRYRSTPDPRLAAAHRDGRPFTPLPLRDLPAHGLQTTVRDLGRFASAMLSGGSLGGHQVFPPAIIEAMLAPQNTDVPLDLDIVNGLGWFLEEGSIDGATRVARHSGAALGYSAEIILLPEQGFGAAVLANAGGAGRVLRRLTETMLSQSLKRVPEPLPPDLLFATPAVHQSGQGSSIDPAGSYATDFGMISIEPRHARVCSCMTGATADLVTYADGWYGLASDDDALPGAVRPLSRMRLQTRRIDGHEVVVADTGSDEVLLGEKVPPAPVPGIWKKRVGRYAVINPDPAFPLEDLELVLNHGKLCMRYRMPVLTGTPIQVPLRPLSDEAAIILGLGRGRGDTIRVLDAGGEAPVLRWSGYLARRAGD